MFESTSRVWAGAFVALGLVVSGYLLGNNAKSYVDSQRQVSVKGYAEREVNANLVSWPVVMKNVGNDLVSLSGDVDNQIKTILKFLMDNGLSKEEISVSPTEIIDMEAERYRSEKPIYRYNTTSVIMITSEKVDLVRTLLTKQKELISRGVSLAGGDYRYEVQYMYTQLNDIKTDMIKEATQKARAVAEEFAKDSQSKLGKIKSANQGQISISDRDALTPNKKIVRVVTSVVYSLED
ncbi:MAG TPA: hypothetical protein DDY68_01175 [Porphyromonadaceae bacterium]|nr:hypothetical protein [Porphyromonadaceae bacterium]